MTIRECGYCTTNKRKPSIYYYIYVNTSNKHQIGLNVSEG